jgi:hypothetical protein
VAEVGAVRSLSGICLDGQYEDSYSCKTASNSGSTGRIKIFT